MLKSSVREACLLLAGIFIGVSVRAVKKLKKSRVETFKWWQQYVYMSVCVTVYVNEHTCGWCGSVCVCVCVNEHTYRVC